MKRVIKGCLLQLITKKNLVMHFRIALIVGFVINGINQFDPIISLNLGEINFIKGIITFIVPFTVSVYSAYSIEKL